jgi:hypothetical protein
MTNISLGDGVQIANCCSERQILIHRMTTAVPVNVDVRPDVLE